MLWLDIVEANVGHSLEKVEPPRDVTGNKFSPCRLQLNATVYNFTEDLKRVKCATAL